MSLDVALNYAVSGLTATQQQLQVVAGNISNAQTPGYSEETLPQFSSTSTNGGATSIGGNAVEVGWCGYTNGSDPCVYEWGGRSYLTYTDRAYFRMDTSQLEQRNGFSAQVYSATFYDEELYNSNGCTSQPVALYASGAISSSTTWSGPQQGSSPISTAPSTS